MTPGPIRLVYSPTCQAGRARRTHGAKPTSAKRLYRFVREMRSRNRCRSPSTSKTMASVRGGCIAGGRRYFCISTPPAMEPWCSRTTPTRTYAQHDDDRCPEISDPCSTTTSGSRSSDNLLRPLPHLEEPGRALGTWRENSSPPPTCVEGKRARTVECTRSIGGMETWLAEAHLDQRRRSAVR